MTDDDTIDSVADLGRRKLLSWGMVGAGGVMLAPGRSANQTDIVAASARPGAASNGTVVNALDYLSAQKRDDVLYRTGLEDHSAELLVALQVAIDSRRPLYIPSGLWNRGADSTPGTVIRPTLRQGDAVHIYGDGPGMTVIRDRPGQSASATGWDNIFFFQIDAGVTVEQLILRDCTLDKNGASNGPPPSMWAWQQRHICRISVGDGGLLRHALIENVETVDKVGGGIVFAAGLVSSATVRNCHGGKFSGVFGPRGDIEFQSIIDDFIVESCTGSYAQCEPNALTASGKRPRASFINCIFDVLDFIGFPEDVSAQTVVLENCVADKLLLANEVRLLASNSRFQVARDARWRRIAEGSVVDNSTIINRYYAETNSIAPFIPGTDNRLGGFWLTFSNCVFEPGPGATITSTGPCIGSNKHVYSGADPFLLRFVDCRFSPLYQSSADCIRNGIFEFVRCKFGGWSQAKTIGTINVGGLNEHFSHVTIEDCDFSACTAKHNIFFYNANTRWLLTVRGTHDYSAMRFNLFGADQEKMCRFQGKLEHAAAPTGPGLVGMKVTVPNSLIGTPGEYLCTANSATAAAFAPDSGVFAPALDATRNCADLSVYSGQYQRNGRIVSVTGTLGGSSLAAGDVVIAIALPIGQAAGRHIAGTCSTITSSNTSGVIVPDSSDAHAYAYLQMGGAENFKLAYSYQYLLA